MEFLSFIKDIFAEKKTLLTSLGCAVILVLSSGSMKLALAVGIMITVSLTAASAISGALRGFSTELGGWVVYAAVTALFSALFAVAVSVLQPELWDSFSLIAAILPVSGVSILTFSKNESVLYSSIRSFSTGAVITLTALLLAFIRELFGSGSLFGVKIFDFESPFLSGISGGFILCGLLFAVINAVIARFSSEKAKKSHKNSINTEANDADI